MQRLESSDAIDHDGNDLTDPEDADSNPGSDAPHERDVEPGDPDDDNIDGDYKNAGEDEDDHDPADVIVGYDLALRKKVTTPGPYHYQQILTYDIKIFNQGGLPVSEVEVTDYLPCGLEFLAGSNGRLELQCCKWYGNDDL